jgi:hypothetical protein
MSRACPNCELLSPDTAERCDCGFDFVSRTMKGSLLSGREREILKTPKLPWWAAGTTFVILRGAFSLIGSPSSHQTLITIAASVGAGAIVFLLVRRARR